jgi:hypothetical protein
MKYALPTLLVAAAAAGLPAAASASTTIATEQHATPVSACGGAIAWSSYDGGRYKLMLEQGGTVAAVNVATSKAAFDVDLGTAKDGKLVAVYSRGGRLYEYDVAARAEKKLGLSGTHPTIMDGRLAYVARRHGRDTLFLRTDGRTRTVYSAARISDAQLSAKRLAFVTDNAPKQLLQTETLRVQTLAGRPRAIYEARSGGANSADIVGPAFDAAGTHLFWARRNIGSGSGNRFIRHSFATRRTAYAIGTDKVYSVSYIDQATGFATAEIGADDDASAPGGPVTVGTTGAVAFNARP